MTNEAGLEFNRCDQRAENGTGAQENMLSYKDMQVSLNWINGSTKALLDARSALFEIDDEILKIHETIRTVIEYCLSKTGENNTQTDLITDDERQAALVRLHQLLAGYAFLQAELTGKSCDEVAKKIGRQAEPILSALQSPRMPEPTSSENVAMEDEWLREKIGIALGEASMCWSEIPTGVFHSERATQILNDLCCQINIRKSPRVPVIEGLDEAIIKFKHFVLTGQSGGAAMTYPIEMAARAYAELQNGV